MKDWNEAILNKAIKAKRNETDLLCFAEDVYGYSDKTRSLSEITALLLDMDSKKREKENNIKEILSKVKGPLAFMVYYYRRAYPDSKEEIDNLDSWINDYYSYTHGYTHWLEELLTNVNPNRTIDLLIYFDIYPKRLVYIDGVKTLVYCHHDVEVFMNKDNFNFGKTSSIEMSRDDWFCLVKNNSLDNEVWK